MVKWKSVFSQKRGVWLVKNDENEKKLWEPHKERINIRSFLYVWFGLRVQLRSIFSKNVRIWETNGPQKFGEIMKFDLKMVYVILYPKNSIQIS